MAMARKRANQIKSTVTGDSVDTDNSSWSRPVKRPRKSGERDVLAAHEPNGRRLYKPFGDPVGRRSMAHPGKSVRLVSVTQRVQNSAFKTVSGQADLLRATDYVVDFARNKILHMQTIIPGSGTVVGWDTCGECHLHLAVCRCAYLAIPARVLFCAGVNVERII